MFGGGVGYKFNKWIRTDLTLDYETKAKFRQYGLHQHGALRRA